MNPNEAGTKMCPNCNVAMENGVCPKCGMKAEDVKDTDENKVGESAEV